VPFPFNSLHPWRPVDHQPSLSDLKLKTPEREVLQQDIKEYREAGILLKA